MDHSHQSHRIIAHGVVAAGFLLGCASLASAQLCFDSVTGGVGSQPSDVVMGDFDGDGYADLAVANHDALGDNRVAILRNNGDGTFEPSVFYEVGERPYWLACADFNLDGQVDLAVTNFFGASISVLINLGGTFAPHVLYEAGGGPTFIAHGFIDGNDSPDLIVSNAGDDTVSVYLNNGDGTFADQVMYPVGALPYGVVARDLNNDGWTDVAVSNYGSGKVNTEISVLLNNGDGTLARHQVYYAGIAAVGIDAVDVDNDGFADLVTANEGFVAENNTLSVLRNNGDGTFAPHVEYVVGVGPYDVTSADFNADGFADLATANEEGTVSILINNGDGTFADGGTATVAAGALGIATGDLDGNGTPEIATACYVADEVWVLFNAYAGFVAQPSDVEVAVGDLASFNAVAVGPEPLTYQWRKDGFDLNDGANVSGATTDTLTIDPVGAADVGSYDLVVTNDCGSLESTLAQLTIAEPACPADLNGDGFVGGADLAIVLGSWGSCRGCAADLTGDGVVGGADIAIILGFWGPCR